MTEILRETPDGEMGLLIKELALFSELLPGLLATDAGRYALVGRISQAVPVEFVAAYDTQYDAIITGYQEFGNVPFLTREIREPALVQPIALLPFDR